MDEMSKKLEQIEALLSNAAYELSTYRKRAAQAFSQHIVQHLNDLGMPNASFIPQWTTTENYTTRGLDEVLFLLSANPGEEPKPLYKIASGGELSRIALAIKTVCARDDLVSTMIFDEVDAGIGGQTAQMVADKIALVALDKQVICITQSPAIACMADSHIFFEKKLEGERTSTTVRQLNSDERLLEITRMIFGNNYSKIAKENAAEIIENAKRKKEKWKNNA
jgi:DNA repair protein RecN (Recombination protein N)